MPWFKVDDSFWGHPKRVATPPAALGLWVTAGSWSGHQLTDGFIPKHMLQMFGGTPKAAAALVTAGLWEKAEGGWRFHDWDDTQPSAESVRTARAKEAARKAEWRRKRDAAASGPDEPPPDDDVPPDVPPGHGWDTNGTHPGTDGGTPTGRDGGHQRDSPARPRVRGTRPDPTRPSSSVTADAVTPDGAADGAPSTAQTLIAEWIDHCPGGRPPGRVIGQVSREVGAMLAEGIPYADVRTGLAAWHQRGLNPATLASVVHEIRTAPARRTTGTRPSTTDERVGAALDLAARYDAEDGTGPLATVHQLTIGDTA